MTLSRIGRISRALVVSMAVVLGMSACGGYTVGFMWVLGTQYNQITGFKIDDYTGNLTQMVNSPYSSGGTNPVSIAVRVGGNFVFVVNKGTGAGDGNVAVFSVGQDGILTFQNSYNARPRLSPDESQLAFVTQEDGAYRIATLDLRGRGDVQVLTKGRFDVSPSYAPNGAVVIYASRDRGRGVLALVSADGRVQERLVSSEGEVQEPAWSPF